MTEIAISADIRAALEEFMLDYVHCIDDDELERWPSFFAQDGLYQIIAREGHEAGHRLGVMLCRGRGMMADRVHAMRQANIFEPQRYTHILSRTKFERLADAYAARTNFQVVRTMQDGASDLFVSGRYLDRIGFGSSGPSFLERRVLLDSRRIDTLLVVPL